MSTRFVPVVAVLPHDDYVKLCDVLALVELPADIRNLLAEKGWTPEQVMLGRILSDAAQVLTKEEP
jgi:hypothetical protein